MPPIAPRRLALIAAAFGLAAGVWLLLRHDAPKADSATLAALAGLPAACAIGLALTLDAAALGGFSLVIGVGALAALGLGAANLDAPTLLVVLGLASLGVLLGGAWGLWRASRGLAAWRFNGDLALIGAHFGLLTFYTAWYIVASHDLMFADFMFFRRVSIAVAAMLDRLQFVQLLIVTAASAKEDYSWLPALAPGAALALGAPLARWPYEAALIVCYAAPAYLALGALARELARGASPQCGRAAPAPALGFAALIAFAAYPTGMAITARGMPDIGGLVLFVAALRLSARLARLLALRPGHDARVGAMVRRVALALALCLYAMFLFRRWYVFAGVGIVAALGLEVAALAAARRARFRWREAAQVAALAGLALFALASPVLIDWLPDPAAHDYVQIYAAYRKDAAIFAMQIFDWWGLGVLAAAVGGALLLFALSRRARLLRLTVGSAIVAALLFLRVQTPYIHHLFLIAPAVTGVIGAAMLLLLARSKPLALAGAGALAAFTLTPAVSAFAPGLAPTAGQPHKPRADLAELAHLKTWFDAHATPQHRVCALGSSYTFSDQLIGELWQLDGLVSPLYASRADRPDVVMAHVDTADGGPVEAIKDCAMMLVGDPVQTHLLRDYQQTIVVPASEMLAGVGIGASFRRTGETFALENGVTVVVFERAAPLDDNDIAALRARWREARMGAVVGLRGTGP